MKPVVSDNYSVKEFVQAEIKRFPSRCISSTNRISKQKSRQTVSLVSVSCQMFLYLEFSFLWALLVYSTYFLLFRFYPF